MKNKLKALFAYFRGLKQEELFFNITFGYNTIEEFSDISLGGTRKFIEPAKPIRDIIEEVIKKLMPTFHHYNDYNEDDWWSLEVSIYPFKNEIHFTSECKYANSVPEQLQMEFSDLSEELQDTITEIEEENNLTKIQFDFIGIWDVDILNILFDDKFIKTTNELTILFQDVTDKLMSKNYGKYWTDDGGFTGDITIWGDDIFLDLENRLVEWGNTDMDITITPDFFDDTDEK